ncbi:hypothetical protein B0O99DRAFT_644601 [Bisporella sp. PMI_857]|nr:hypothetical protein B0O99DRAFT_644601 [Bisporella sp. PMI_857]
MHSFLLVIVRGFESIKDNHQSDEDLANLFQGWFRGAQVIIFNSCPRNSIRPGWIQKQSDELLSILINDRQSFTQVVGESSRSRPIVILASNVGGFVVKRALVQATNNWQYQSIISSTIAVVRILSGIPWDSSYRDSTGAMGSTTDAPNSCFRHSAFGPLTILQRNFFCIKRLIRVVLHCRSEIFYWQLYYQPRTWI